MTKLCPLLLLQVANLRASKSDDKKFYVYSGTKTLEMRAETTQDRDSWMSLLEVRPSRRPCLRRDRLRLPLLRVSRPFSTALLAFSRFLASFIIRHWLMSQD